MQQIQLGIFWAIVTAFIVCGCILTRKPTKKPPRDTLRPAAPDEHQPGCFALEEVSRSRNGAKGAKPGAQGMMLCTTSLHPALNMRGVLLHIVHQARLGGHPPAPDTPAAQPLEA